MLPHKFEWSKWTMTSTPNTTLHTCSNPHQMRVVQTLRRKLLFFPDCSLQSCCSKVPYKSWSKCCIKTGLNQNKHAWIQLNVLRKQRKNKQMTKLTWQKAGFKKLQVLHEVLALQDSDMNCQYYDTTLWSIPNLKSIQLRIKSVKNTPEGNMEKKREKI